MILYSNINQILSNFDTNSFEKYFHELVDYWLDRGKLNYQTYSNLVELEHWWNLEKETELIIKHVLNSILDEQFLEHLKLNFKFGPLFLKVFNLRKSELIDYFVSKTNDLNETSLKDFDWSLNLITSSDKLSKLNESNIKLSLHLDDKSSNICFELNRNELDEFINNLETIQKNMDFYD